MILWVYFVCTHVYIIRKTHIPMWPTLQQLLVEYCSFCLFWQWKYFFLMHFHYGTKSTFFVWGENAFDFVRRGHLTSFKANSLCHTIVPCQDAVEWSFQNWRTFHVPHIKNQIIHAQKAKTCSCCVKYTCIETRCI